MTLSGLFGLRGVIASLFTVWLISVAGPASASPAFSPEQKAAIGQALTGAMKAKVESYGMPSLAMAVFDDKGVIWEGAYGYADAAKTKPADSQTIYRAGSVSKLFTDILVMQLVEEGRVSLDAPLQTYLPDFKPENPFGKPVTLRLLMTHRSGLIREPPAGSYFGDGDPGAAAVARSLSGLPLVAEPGTVTKYSNAGIELLRHVLETVSGKTYDDLVEERIFKRSGMTDSSFTLTKTGDRLAYAEVALYGAPRSPAPRIELGLKAAGSLNTTTGDLSRFGVMLLNEGRGPGGRVLKAKTLKTMQTVQFPKADGTGYGLGFVLGDVGGVRTIGHGGAIYGFTTNFVFVPEFKLGVVAFGAVDLTAAPFQLDQYAASVVMAVRNGQPIPPPPGASTAVPVEQGRRLAGYFINGTDSVVLRVLDNKLLLDAPIGGGEVRLLDGALVLDSDLTFDESVVVDPNGAYVRLGDVTYSRATWYKPDEPPASITSLIGDYGPDHNILRVYERDGHPYLFIEGSAKMIVVDDNTWSFGDDSPLYPREKIVFTRNAQGRGQSISLNGLLFERRDTGDIGEDEALSRLSLAERRKIMAGLRAEALKAAPPIEIGDFLKPDLVSLRRIDPSLTLDVRYAGTNNFLGVEIYDRPTAALQRPAAEAVSRINAALKPKGYKLIVYDGYRPWHITKIFWDLTPEEDKIFVANPAEGSRHNRGAAVDLSMIDLATGQVVEMPGGYDEASDRSYAAFVGGTSLQRWLRDTLVSAMEADGFDVYPYEWWHFDFRTWRRYPIQNILLDP